MTRKESTCPIDPRTWQEQCRVYAEKSMADVCLTSVVMPDADLPDLSQICVSLHLENILAVSLEGPALVQVARATFVQPI